MVFVELTPFVAFREEHWTDDDLRALQSFLLVSPDAGDLIRGGQRADLNRQQIKMLAELMKDMKDG